MSIAESPREGSADERCEREHGASSPGADAPLCKQIEIQARAVTRRAARQQREDVRDGRKLLATSRRYDRRQAGAEYALEEDHLERITLGERAGKRVVHRPGGGGTGNREHAVDAKGSARRGIECQRGSAGRHA